MPSDDRQSRQRWSQSMKGADDRAITVGPSTVITALADRVKDEDLLHEHADMSPVKAELGRLREAVKELAGRAGMRPETWSGPIYDRFVRMLAAETIGVSTDRLRHVSARQVVVFLVWLEGREAPALTAALERLQEVEDGDQCLRELVEEERGSTASSIVNSSSEDEGGRQVRNSHPPTQARASGGSTETRRRTRGSPRRNSEPPAWFAAFADRMDERLGRLEKARALGGKGKRWKPGDRIRVTAGVYEGRRGTVVDTRDDGVGVAIDGVGMDECGWNEVEASSGEKYEEERVEEGQAHSGAR